MLKPPWQKNIQALQKYPAIDSLAQAGSRTSPWPGKTFEIRFYIQHRCVVQSVEFADANSKTPDKEQFAKCLARSTGWKDKCAARSRDFE
jgi:hypothetical protein